uniref:Serine/threonine kinase 19 n=1 Tax=Molossus molossus TaxID=27622 RepID=A0A7J8GTK0_MOLMO|nr:serine/threonine kinase 19 [Molossus molossus]
MREGKEEEERFERQKELNKRESASCVQRNILGRRSLEGGASPVCHLWFQVLKACDGRSYAGAVQKFLASVLPACGDLSVQQDQMTQTFGFRDMEITQLVNAGVLTVRDAGSWWLAVPGAGRFIKHFVKGRQAVLGMVRKAKYRELLLSELLGRRAPASVRLGLAYHVHDLIGAQLVDCVSTTSGTLLRLPET